MAANRIRRLSRVLWPAIGALVIGAIGGGAASAQSGHPGGHPVKPAATPAFSVGQPQTSTVGASGCAANSAGEPQIRIGYDGTMVAGSELGLGGGSVAWSGKSAGFSGTGCGDLVYRGQPNGNSGVGASGGDIDIAIGSATNASGHYPVYISSLNLGSVNVARSADGGTTYSDVPVVGGVPVDDREWIAAYGSSTALLSYHDISTDNIDVLRSDDGGQTFLQTGQAIPATDYKASDNELGNIAVDRRNTAGATGFWAYQSFVAPSTAPAATNSNPAYNEAFLAVSSDGGHSWTDKPIGCSTSASASFDHQFPQVSVAPNGTLWYAWSDDTNIYTASSTDHGSTWSCSGPVSRSGQNIEPWLVAGSAGVDLVYYGTGTTSASNPTWSVYFAQNTGSGWGAAAPVTTVHTGAVCEGGVSCTTGRQLFDDFGVDVDPGGVAHIVYSHDAPDLGGTGTYTGYAVQTAGTTIGYNN